MHFVLALMFVVRAIALQEPQTFTLKRFQVIRINPADLRRLPESMRSIFSDPVPDGAPADTLDEAAKRVGFSPLLINGKTPKRIFVTEAVNIEAKINVGALVAGLKEAKADDVTVPADWEGTIMQFQHRPGILVDYGDFYIAQAPPSTLSTPSGFPVAQCLNALFRILGMSAQEASGLREQFATNPSNYLPIAPRFDMAIREVPMTTGPGLLLQNGDKIGELAFMWSTADRSYFLTGLVTEDEAIAIGNSLQ